MQHSDDALKRHFSPGILVLIAAVIAFLMVMLAYTEIRHGKELIRELTYDKGTAVINQVERGLALALRANREVENEVTRRLLAAARTVARENPESVTPADLERIARDHGVHFLEVLDHQGSILGSNKSEQSKAMDISTDFRVLFTDLFKGNRQEQVLGMHVPRRGEGSRFSVAVRSQSGGIVVAGVDAAEIGRFRRSFGLGRLLQDAGRLHDVNYLVIQDEDGIVAATEKISRIGSIQSDPVLQEAWRSSKPVARMLEGDPELFEVIKRIEINTAVPALLRVAFDGRVLIATEKKARRRIMITLVGLALLLAVAVNALVIYQNLKVTRRARDEAVSLSDAVLRDMADGVIVLTRDGDLRLINERARALMPGFLPPLPPSLQESVRSAFESEVPVLREVEIPIKDGDRHVVTVAASRLRVGNEPSSMVVCVLHDVTRERQMEKQVRLNEKVIAMGNLAGAVAHEVRNPLNAIGITVQRLQAEFTPSESHDEYAGLINIIIEEIKRLDDIIGQFLKFARAPMVEKTVGNLAESIESVIRELAGLADSRSIRLNLESPPDLQVSFDPKQLRQVWLNLVTNAIDACSEGDAITIRLREEDQAAVVEIVDTGPGMDEEERSRIFDLYYTTKDRGTGLGLPITLRIVHAHEGTLDLKSGPGQGTKITVRLKKE